MSSTIIIQLWCCVFAAVLPEKRRKKKDSLTQGKLCDTYALFDFQRKHKSGVILIN